MPAYELEKNYNPLDRIDTDFGHYVARRRTSEEEHLINGIPDYAFDLDYELRAKIMKIPHFYSISKKITASLVAQQIQLLNQQGIAVGPQQFPDIYEMGVDCASKLGIGVPNIYVINNPQMNAYTVAADDISPIVVLHSGIIERMMPGELKCVIAHECGHIHNNHAVLKVVVNQILESGSGLMGMVLSVTNLALMQLWTRAGEITSDRASMICADDPEDAYKVNGKIMYGSVIGKEMELNYKELRAQLDMTLDNPTRILEILSDHPSGLRRIFAEMEFAQSEIYYKWRPEMKKPGAVIQNKAETDAKCKKLVNIVKNK